MNKRKKRFGAYFFVRIYLSILIFLITFFTLFAFRYDVIKAMYPNKQTAFALSEKRTDELKQEIAKKKIVTSIVGSEISKLIPEYSFSIYTYEDPTRQVKETEGMEDDEQDDQQAYFYLTYGNTPNEMSSLYGTTERVDMDGGAVEIVLYPKFTSFLENYIKVIMAFSVLVLLLSLWILHLMKKHQCMKKMIDKLTKKLKWNIFHRLALKMLLVNVLSAFFAFGCFYYMYVNRYAYFEFIDTVVYQEKSYDGNYQTYVDNISKQVKNLELNKANKKKIINLLSERRSNDMDYVYLYDEKGIYYVGSQPTGGYLDAVSSRNSFYDVSAVRTPKMFSFHIQYKKESGSMLIYSYPLTPYVMPYMTVIILIAISLFLIVVLGFFNKKVKQILMLKEDVMILANGNLDHKIVDQGKDEIALLAYNLDRMRMLLNENIQNEEQSRKNNSELITSMSHDLRTPLTSIKAYLDILKYRKYKDDEQYEKCLDRCIKKTEDIKEMSDAMFEYSLVFEPDHQAQLVDTTLEEVLPYLIDQMEQIEMNHFTVKYQSAQGTCRLKMDNQLLKRIFNNVFSNILKYADVNHPVQIQVALQDDALVMTFVNNIQTNTDKVERNHIGLKSTAKMMNLMHGNLQIDNTEETFTCKLIFAIAQK